MLLSSHAGNGAIMSMLVVACCRVMLVMALPCLASDGAAIGDAGHWHSRVVLMMAWLR
jgi:hypothetical protein